ncbi:Trm112 family protein [Streptomyces sp. NPDC058001]|uniref:Trm112 family protein n=1 Tax=Streptomyces sp. NPDC058001 TaxID=3346300 RepID=UPI0036E0B8E4
MNPDDPLLDILVCPLDKGPLHLLVPGDDATDPAVPDVSLYNPRLRRRYPVLDGVPQLLPSSGVPVTEAEHERLMGLLPPL